MKAWLSLLCCVVVAGCAASPAPGSKPPSTLDAEDEPTTDLDELVRRLSRSEQVLEQELGAPSAGAGAGAEGEAPADAASEPEPAPEAPEEVQAAPKRPSPCETACRALASMQRSSARICELAGESDDRCIGAKDRVERAAARVSGAGCGCG